MCACVRVCLCVRVCVCVCGGRQVCETCAQTTSAARTCRVPPPAPRRASVAGGGGANGGEPPEDCAFWRGFRVLLGRARLHTHGAQPPRPGPARSDCTRRTPVALQQQRGRAAAGPSGGRGRAVKPHAALRCAAGGERHLAAPSLLVFGRRSAPTAFCSPACSPTGPLTTPSCPPPRPAPPAACTSGSMPSLCTTLKIWTGSGLFPHPCS